MDKGEDYDKMEKSIVISFIEGMLFPDEYQFHSVYTLRNRETGKQLSDLLELHYIELNKIPWKEKPLEDLNPLEQLGTYIMLSGKDSHTDILEALVQQGEGVISMTDKVLTKVSEEERLHALRFSRELKRMDDAVALKAARKEGLEEGRAEGRAERLTETAQKMKADNLPVDLIQKYTGLTEDEITKL